MQHALLLAMVLFALGTVGVLMRRNLIVMLMSVEIMLNAAGLAFIAAGSRWGQPDGQVMFILILALAAAEVVVGPALILRARMRGGQINKARRGELEIGPPVGLVYRSEGRLDLDPDAEVQAALRLVFDTFDRLGSATRTVRFFLDNGILFPRRLRKEPNKGELVSGGAARTLVLDRPLPIAQIRKFKPELVAEVDRLLDRYCDREIADIFNERGIQTWDGQTFNLKKIDFIRGAYNLASRRQRLRDRGMLTTEEVAERFDIAQTTVHQWGRQGLIRNVCSDNRNRGLGDIPPDLAIVKGRPGRNALPARVPTTISSTTEQDSV
jgi:NADH:ubiquinone oxidoreductase subunit K